MARVVCHLLAAADLLISRHLFFLAQLFPAYVSHVNAVLAWYMSIVAFSYTCHKCAHWFRGEYT